MNKVLMLLVLLSCGMGLQAQDRTDRIMVHAGGGIHSLMYDFSGGPRSNGIGGQVGGAYYWQMKPDWYITSGLNVATFSTKAKPSSMLTETMHDDANGYEYYLRTYYDKFEEKQNAVMLGIPVGVAYAYSLGNGRSLLLSGGVNIAVPVSSRYKTSGNLDIRGYYPDLGVEMSDMPNHGFYKSSAEYKGDAKLKGASVGLFADGGVRFSMLSARTLYVGAYCGYGLTDALKGSSNALMDANGQYQGVLNSSSVDGGHLFMAGLKVGISFSRSRNAKIAPMPEQTANLEPEAGPAPVKEVEPEPVIVPDPEPFAEPKAKAEEPVQDSTAELANRIAKKHKENVAEVQLYADSLSAMMTFKIDSFEPDKKAALPSAFDKLAAKSKEYQIRIYVKGHTCDTGTDEANQQVGLGRANYIKEQLVARGVDPSNIVIAASGSKEPLVPNSSDANRAKNRRVTIHIE